MSAMTMRAGRVYRFRKRAGDLHRAGDLALCIEEKRTGTFAGGILLTAHGQEAMGDSEAGEFLVEAGGPEGLVPGVTAADLPYSEPLMAELQFALAMVSDGAGHRKGSTIGQGGETP